MPILCLYRFLSFRHSDPVRWIADAPGPCSATGLCRPLLRQIWLVCIAVGCCLFFSGHVQGSQNAASGVVTADFLNLRPEPNLDKPPIKTLRRGAKLVIHESFDGWLKVSFGDQTGYVRDRAQYVRKIEQIQKSDSATGGSEENISRIKKEAEDIQRQIEQSRQAVDRYSRKETDTINRLEAIDLTINDAVQRIAVLKSEREALDQKIETTASDILKVQERISETEIYASKRLVALYKLSQLGRIHVLASADSVYDLLQRKAALQKVLARDEQMWEALRKDNARLKSLLEEMKQQRIQKQVLGKGIEKQIQVKYQERKKRAQLLDDIRSKKSLSLSVISALKQAAIDLDRTIQSLSIEKPAREKAPPPETQVKEEATGPDDLPGMPFGELKGLLNIPVNGKIVTHFGRFTDAELNVVNFRSGIDIQADRGEPIHAVCSGRVQYASWFKGYGNMMIIDHGDNYYTVYAHAEELFKIKGDIVEINEVIATVGDSGSVIGPALHFELRYHGKPLDPLKWMKKG